MRWAAWAVHHTLFAQTRRPHLAMAAAHALTSRPAHIRPPTSHEANCTALYSAHLIGARCSHYAQIRPACGISRAVNRAPHANSSSGCARAVCMYCEGICTYGVLLPYTTVMRPAKEFDRARVRFPAPTAATISHRLLLKGFCAARCMISVHVRRCCPSLFRMRVGCQRTERQSIR
jgi:hypothetical protein